jgi:hypothetical protein
MSTIRAQSDVAARINEVAVIVGVDLLPLTEKVTVRIKPALAARLARMTLDTGWSAEKFILDLLDDALPAPSREPSTNRE